MPLTTVSLPRRRVLALFHAIAAMNGRPEANKGDDGKVAGFTNKTYKYDSVKPTYALARTYTSIEPEARAIEKCQREETAKLGKDATDADKAAASERVGTFLDEKIDIEVHTVEFKELKVKDNEILPTVLGDLLPMVVGEPD